jgi:hypothetical protein
VARVDIMWPWNLPQPINSGSPGARRLNLLGDYIAFIRQADEDAVITEVGFYFDSRSTNAGNPVVRVGIQTVDATGNITGTWLGYTDYVGNATNFPNFTGLTLSITANGTASVTRGQIYAIVLYAQSGTYDATNNVGLGTISSNVGQIPTAFPTMVALQSGVRSDSNQAQTIVHWANSSSQTYGNPLVSVSTIAAYGTGSGSTPNEYGVKFTVPSGWTQSFTVLGIQCMLTPANATATFDMLLYDSTNNVLQSKSFTALEIRQGAGSPFLRTLYFDEPTLTSLTPGSTYRVTIKATSATAATAIVDFSYANATYARAYVGTGGLHHRTERINTGAWTDTTARTLAWKLIINDAIAPPPSGSLTAAPRYTINAGIN